MTDPYESVPGIRWSHLKHAAVSLAHYRAATVQPSTDSDAKTLGRLTHCAVFEPDEVPLRYVVWRGGRRQGNEWRDFCEANSAAEIVTESQWDAACAIRDAVRSHPEVAPLLAAGRAEQVFTWTDDATGLPCRCKVDWLTDTVAADLKTARVISRRGFGNAAASLCYHGQFAYYDRGLKAHGIEVDWSVIAAENAGPVWDVGCFTVSEDAMWAGDELVTDLLAKVARATQRDEWPGIWPHTAEMPLAAWVYEAADAAYERKLTGQAPGREAA